MTRHFSVDEANALLPRVRSLVESVLAARQRVLDAQPEVWPVLQKAIGNGGSQKAGELVEELKRIERGIKAMLGGREVFLCWRYDEPHVGFWHELYTGFAGRQPL